MGRAIRRVDCSAIGFTRRRRGRGFVYFDECGQRITNAAVLDRIRALTIPPAWTEVWICPDERGHIQAIGFDARGRRQYRYHDIWRQRRDREKFDHMLDFARALPALRARAAGDLAGGDLSRDRVLACAARLLDLGFFRIGTEGYAEENQTYGLATIEKRHVRVSGDTVEFDYVSKGGKRRIESVVDSEVVAVIEALMRRRGGRKELLAWRDGRRWTDVRSVDINDYIKEATGGDFTAKDFRTWSATVLAAIALGVSREATSPTARKRAITRCFKEVAHYLGNTPAVCRSSYVDPKIIDRYRAGATIRPTLERLAERHLEVGTGPGTTLLTQGLIEDAVIDLLDETSAMEEAA